MYNATNDSYTIAGKQYPRRQYVWQTDEYINVLVNASRQNRPPAQPAISWLRAIGLTDYEAVKYWLHDTRVNLLSPADSSNIVRCRRCGTTLTATVSKARGVGPECLRKAA